MKTRNKFLAALLLLCLLMVLCAGNAAARSNPVLRYRADGTFRILVFADTHMNPKTSPKMTVFMNEALNYAKPDLVVFTGDNVTGSACKNEKTMLATIKALLLPVTSRKLPFAFVFGNHDLTDFGGFDFGQDTRETLLAMYQSIPGCLTFSENPKNPGFSSFHLPVYSSGQSKKLVSNLWFFDSGGYRFKRMSFTRDWVKQDQIDWYKEASRKLQRENGGKPVPSLAFQHIVVPELYDYFPQSPFPIPPATETIMGVPRLFLPDFLQTDETLRGLPSPAKHSNGELAAWKERGDIFAAVFGHHHANSFTAQQEGIDLVALPSVNFGNAYNANVHRGAALFTLRESAPRSYNHEKITYRQLAARPDSNIGNPNHWSDGWTWLISLLEAAVHLAVYFL